MFFFWSADLYLGFRFGLPLLQVCFVKFACENIYELMYLVVFIGDIAMF